MTLVRRVFLVTIATISVLTLAATGDQRQAAATHGSTPDVLDFISIDVNPDATPANAKNSLGTREDCISVVPGATFTVDLTIDEVHPDDAIFLFSARLRYAPGVVQVTGVDIFQMLTASGPSSMLNTGESPRQ